MHFTEEVRQGDPEPVADVGQRSYRRVGKAAFDPGDKCPVELCF